jgi:hypothetical protein
MTVSMHRRLVATRLPKSAPALILKTHGILEAMGDNPWFPSPTPSLAAVASALAVLEEAQVAKLSRTRGTRQVRDEKRTALRKLLRQLATYVQSVADANPEHAASIIESSGMSVKRTAVQHKAPFALELGPVSGSVVPKVRSAGDRAMYAWQWSSDAGFTWNTEPSTRVAQTVIERLPVGKRCWFRYRVTTKDGEQNWSQSLSIVVA